MSHRRVRGFDVMCLKLNAGYDGFVFPIARDVENAARRVVRTVGSGRSADAASRWAVADDIIHFVLN
jgi:hypothetical protein